jgi:hypothetical protein
LLTLRGKQRITLPYTAAGQNIRSSQQRFMDTKFPMKISSIPKKHTSTKIPFLAHPPPNTQMKQVTTGAREEARKEAGINNCVLCPSKLMMVVLAS